MNEDPGSRRQPLGHLLVALQFLLLAVVAATAAPAFLRASAPVGAWLLTAIAVALALWAVRANRPGNFNIHPEPRAGGRLVRHGPYRWIRHPMYTSVLTFGVAAAWAAASGWAWLAAAALVPVLAAKAALEERWMAAAHPDYAEYRQHTRRFLPWLF
jgi:protein-S-isoprenylcysteine O-methyltransferase Ste14